MLLISLRFLALMLAALTAGMSFAHVLERPAKMRYDAALYGTLQKTLYAYWGPPNVGAFVEIMAIAATLMLAWLVSDRGSALWMTAGAATALVIAFPIVFFTLVAPANKAFLEASPPAMPADWMEMRARWEDGHVIRFAFHLCALGLLILSVLIEMDA
ncbi:MAG TPA: hypothetical protein VF309_08045 [Usitatibacter sp.]